MRSLRKLTLAAVTAMALIPAVTTTAHADTASAVQIMQGAEQKGIAAGYPGIAALINDGTTSQYVTAGSGAWISDTNRPPIDPAAQFRIGSITKQFTATVLLQLEAEGKLSINDTIAKWLPTAIPASTGYDGTKVTLRELMNQTSGLPDYTLGVLDVTTLNANTQYAPQDLVNRALKTPPGTQVSDDPVVFTTANPPAPWNYINTGYILLGMVIQKVTGNDPSVEVKNRLITPLGLSHTSFPTSDPNLYGSYNHGHYYQMVSTIFGLINIGTLDVTVQSPSGLWAAGAMVSNLQDLMTFMQKLVQGTLLPAAQMTELETTVAMNDKDIFGQPTNGQFGLGIMHGALNCSGTTKWVWTMGGDTYGYHSHWYVSEDGRKAVLYTTNEYHGVLTSPPPPGIAAITTGGKDSMCALL